jgi:hypothetical protein
MKATLSSKDYPLVIETVVDESNSPSSYYTKGHAHDLAAFLRAVVSAAHSREDLNYESGIEYCWLRKRPLLPAERDEFCFGYWVDSATPGTPGAFPAMVMFLD